MTLVVLNAINNGALAGYRDGLGQVQVIIHDVLIALFFIQHQVAVYIVAVLLLLVFFATCAVILLRAVFLPPGFPALPAAIFTLHPDLIF